MTVLDVPPMYTVMSPQCNRPLVVCNGEVIDVSCPVCADKGC